MDKVHSNQPKYEILSLPENPEGVVKAEEVEIGDIPEEDHFIIQESWSYPQTWMVSKTIQMRIRMRLLASDLMKRNNH